LSAEDIKLKPGANGYTAPSDLADLDYSRVAPVEEVEDRLVSRGRCFKDDAGLSSASDIVKEAGLPWE
jgi:hypothetical protein